MNKDKFKIGFLSVFNIGTKVLEKNNVLVAYTHDSQHSLYFRGENEGYRRRNPSLEDPTSIFDNIIVDYVNNVDKKTKAAV